MKGDYLIMKDDWKNGKLLLLILLIYYLGIIYLYSLVNPSIDIIHLGIIAIIIILAFIGTAIIAIKLNKELNRQTQLFLCQLFLVPPLLFSVNIGLDIFSLPALVTVCILILIYISIMLLPFIYPSIKEWFYINIFHSKPILMKIAYWVFLGIFIIVIIGYLLMGNSINKYIGDNSRAYRDFLRYYLLTLFGSLLLSTIAKRNID